MKFGYVRVSKDEQNQDLQFDAIKAEGCERIFHEKISGAAKNHPEFEQLREHFSPSSEAQ